MTVATWTQLLASLLEIAGVLLMANAHVAVAKGSQIPGLLVVAVWRGAMARGAAKLDGVLSQEDRLKTLQGLAFIAAGFLLQVGATLAEALLQPPRA